jgi:hypothetical protein
MHSQHQDTSSSPKHQATAARLTSGRGLLSPLRFCLGMPMPSYSSGSNLGAAMPALARLARCASAHRPLLIHCCSKTSLSFSTACRTGSLGAGL